MNKTDLRRHFLAQRKSLPANEVDARSQKICQLFFANPFMDGKSVVHSFLPILHQNEINTWPIINRLWAMFPPIQVLASVTDSETRRLTHYNLTPVTRLIKNRWGIPEPASDAAEPVSATLIDLALVPLLAIDQQGNRVGYGGGFYDRFLADCRPDCLTVGLSLTDPIEQIDDTEPTDIPLNVCVTPERVWFFSK